MNKLIYTIFFLAISVNLFAGNPDRQGEAGAAELLMNPWARSAGLHSMTTSFVYGVEAMRLNVAGISRINSTEVSISQALYLRQTDITMNSLGVAQKVWEGGTIGVSLMTLNFGDIQETTDDQPEGTGATFSPSFFNLGLAYAHTFENKVSVGILFRVISETIKDVSALGFAIDAGVQYVTGEQDNFKLGISLRNVGAPMRFTGQGLAVLGENPRGDIPYELTFNQRSEDFELPSVLNIGMSYDFLLDAVNRLTVVANFTSNSFSQDQYGGGIEYAFNDLVELRAGYKYEVGSEDEDTAPIYSGFSGGVSFNIPLSKEGNSIIGLDYGYRQTRLWDGTHNFTVRIGL